MTNRIVEQYSELELVAAFYKGEYQGKIWMKNPSRTLLHIKGESISDVIEKLRQAAKSPEIQELIIKAIDAENQMIETRRIQNDQMIEAIRLQNEKQEKIRLEIEKVKIEVAAEKERIRNLSITDRHREKLNKIGIDYRGVRLATQCNQKRRVTHCYCCKKPLDNNVDIECVSCNWILCICGSCGCGYHKPN